MDGRDTSDDIDLSDRRVVALLATTVEFVTGDAATITAVNQLPIAEGSSGAALSRVDVTYTTRHLASASIGLVLKMCSDIELAVLLRLQAAHPRHTPYIQSSPIRASDQTLTCLQDLGANYRPDSLSEISADLQQNEAQALADIHTQNLDTELDWLPEAGREYYAWTIEEQFFRPAWQTALADPRFRERFASSLNVVEQAASTTIEEMTELSAVAEWRTLVHTDINPSNVLIVDGQPYIIDWGTARQGPLFLDLPHHLSTRAQAEDYRVALSQRGLPTPTPSPTPTGPLHATQGCATCGGPSQPGRTTPEWTVGSTTTCA